MRTVAAGSASLLGLSGQAFEVFTKGTRTTMCTSEEEETWALYDQEVLVLLVKTPRKSRPTHTAVSLLQLRQVKFDKLTPFK